MSKNVNSVETKYKKFRTYGVLSAILAFLFLLSHAFMGMNHIFGSFMGVINILGIGIFGSLSKTFFNKSNKYLIGLEGEEVTDSLLKTLPNDYMVISDINIKEKNAQLDHLVIGNNCLFIIETKNMKGYINGDIDDKHWIQKKVSSGNNVYEKSFYNPMKQVSTHNWKLREYLKENGIKTYVNSVVFFTNNEVDLDISNLEDSKVRLFKNYEKESFISFILEEDKKGKEIDNESKNKLINLLK